MKLERNVFKSVRCSLESPQYSHFSFSVAAKSPFIWRRKIHPSTHTHLENIITTGNSLALLCSHFPHNYYYTIKTQKTVVREVMVLYWSLWFLIRGSHSQGETFTMRPLLYDNLRQRNENPLFSRTSMNRENRRRWDLAETSVPGPYSYTKTCGIINEKYTIIMTLVFWVIRELVPAAVQWLLHHFVMLVEAWLENKTSTLCTTAAFPEIFPTGDSNTLCQKL